MLFVGLLAVLIMVAPAGAHVGKAFAHLWKEHIKHKVTDLVYTKAQSDEKFLSNTGKAADSDELDGSDSTDFAPSEGEAWRIVGDPGEPEFDPIEDCEWSHYEYDSNPNTEWPRVAFYKDQIGIVHLRGLAQMTQPSGNCADDGVADRTIFILPEGYRPEGTVLLQTMANGSPERLDIKEDGSVISGRTYAGDPIWVSLDVASFRAGDPTP
jgi:hypothetical protein